MFHDEDVAYAQRLRAAGVDTTLEVIAGAPHGVEAWAADRWPRGDEEPEGPWRRSIKAKSLDPRSFGFSVLGTNPTVPEPCSFTYKADHYVSWYLIGTTNEDVKKNYALMDELYKELKPLIKGYYINEIDLTHFPHMAQECFSPEKWKKLQAVHQQYDPKKRFSTYLNG